MGNSTLSIVSDICNARNVEDLWQLQLDTLATFGFDRLMFGSTRQHTETSFGDPQDFVILTNLSPAYVEGYVDSQLFRSGPMIRWARENVGGAPWDTVIEQSCLSNDEQSVMEFNSSHNIVAGVTVSFPPVNQRTKAALALVAKAGLTQQDVNEIWAAEQSDLMVICNVFHLKLLTLPYDQRRRLTNRQREVLEWVGDGKTTQDIAQIMGLTAATVEKHMRLARESMDVETTAQAVLKAAFYNQIFVLEA